MMIKKYYKSKKINPCKGIKYSMLFQNKLCSKPWPHSSPLLLWLPITFTACSEYKIESVVLCPWTMPSLLHLLLSGFHFYLSLMLGIYWEIFVLLSNSASAYIVYVVLCSSIIYKHKWIDLFYFIDRLFCCYFHSMVIRPLFR